MQGCWRPLFLRAGAALPLRVGGRLPLRACTSLLLRAGTALLLLAALAWPLRAYAPAALIPGPADEPQLQSLQPAAAAARSKAEQTRSDDDPAPLLAAVLPADPSPAAAHRAARRWQPRREQLTPALIHKYHASRYKSA